jgi:hypothetical protein
MKDSGPRGLPGQRVTPCAPTLLEELPKARPAGKSQLALFLESEDYFFLKVRQVP